MVGWGGGGDGGVGRWWRVRGGGGGRWRRVREDGGGGGVG